MDYPTQLTQPLDEQQFIRAVRSYAHQHYESGGWDEVAEAWDDGDILEYYQTDCLEAFNNWLVLSSCATSTPKRFVQPPSKENTMYALIKDGFGNEETRILLADNDTLDPDHWADVYANSMGIDLSSDGEVPDGCEDFSVVITEDPDNTAVCWKSKNYMIAGE